MSASCPSGSCAQFLETVGSSKMLSGLVQLARKTDALAAQAEESLQRSLKPPRVVQKRLRVCLSHTHAGQHSSAAGEPARAEGL